MEARKISGISDKNNWMIGFRRRKFGEYATHEIPKWKRVKLEHFVIPEIKGFEDTIISNQSNREGIILEDIEEVYKHNRLKDYIISFDEYGFDEKFTTLAESSYNSGFLIRSLENSINKSPIKIEHHFNRTNQALVDYNLIVAEENSEITIVIDYKSKDLAKHFHTGITKVIAKDNSKVNIIKIQRLNKNSESFDINLAYVQGYANVNWISIEIGSNISVSNFVSHLKGVESSSKVHAVYLGDGERKLDLGYTMKHFGMRSSSVIECKGVLKDNSKKVFRGNIDFKRGARKSSGKEDEYVILMDKTVKSDAIPVLLSEEDDVKGEHAASAGQIDGEKMFYLMSRGLSEREAKKLIVEASFKPIIDMIPFNDLKEEVEMDINRRLIDE